MTFWDTAEVRVYDDKGVCVGSVWTKINPPIPEPMGMDHVHLEIQVDIAAPNGTPIPPVGKHFPPGQGKSLTRDEVDETFPTPEEQAASEAKLQELLIRSKQRLAAHNEAPKPEPEKKRGWWPR